MDLTVEPETVPQLWPATLEKHDDRNPQAHSFQLNTSASLIDQSHKAEKAYLDTFDPTFAPVWGHLPRIAYQAAHTAHHSDSMGHDAPILDPHLQSEQPLAKPLLAFLSHIGSASSLSALFGSLTEQQSWQVLQDATSEQMVLSRPRTFSSPAAPTNVSSYLGVEPTGQPESRYWFPRADLEHFGIVKSESTEPRRVLRTFSTGGQAHHTMMSMPPEDANPESTPSIQSKLLTVCNKIVSRIREVSAIERRESIIEHGWTPELEHDCNNFFSSTNCRRFIALYFAAWYPNVPIVHKPTFEPTQANEALLAVIYIFGKQSVRHVVPGAHVLQVDLYPRIPRTSRQLEAG